MVANDQLRRMQEPMKNNHNNNTNEGKTPDEGITLTDKRHSPTLTGDNCPSAHTGPKQSCFFKPLQSAKTRQRKKPISMFEIKPNVTEVTEIQLICIESGVQQDIKESVHVLPELSSNVQSSDETKCAGNDLCQDLPKPRTRMDNGWIDSGSTKDPLPIPMCPGTPPVSPSMRRRSLGVLRTPAWGLRTYRDVEEMETKGGPSLRRRSLVLPVRHVEVRQQSRRKSLVSLDVTELTGPRYSTNTNQLSNSADELGKPSEQKKQQDFENDTLHDEQKNPIDQDTIKDINADSDEEFEEFRPRLRSRSLDDSRTMAREHVLNRGQRSHPQVSKRENSRRKSFEVWLTEKEQETMRKLQMLALERQRASEDEAKRKTHRKGKTYKEWLSDKNNMAVAKDEGSNEKPEEITKQERQEIAKRRYEKWLTEKEMQAIEREREMLKEAKLKTIEMRKKYEERKKNKLRFLKSSQF